MSNILQFEGSENKNTTKNDGESEGIRCSNIIKFIDFVKKRSDPSSLGTPSLSNLSKVNKSRDRFWRLEWYDYLVQYILSSVNKNSEIKLSKIPFFIIKNLDKCSKDELKKIVELINKEVKKKFLNPITKEYLLSIRNLCLNNIKKL